MCILGNERLYLSVTQTSQRQRMICTKSVFSESGMRSQRNTCLGTFQIREQKCYRAVVPHIALNLGVLK